jgi:peptidoglycan/LPS O-acetylase OafA/YrhL
MSSRHSDYRPDIDGLRAVAVLFVILGHAFPQLAPGGFIGVDIFFVISGYLITGIIQTQIRLNRFCLLRFYQRRIRRIFPALIIVLIATFVAGWLVLLPNEFAEIGKQIVASAVFSANLLFYSEIGYFDVAASSKPLLHLWSLGVEEQFYIVWPLLLITLSRLKLSPAIPLALIFACSLISSIIAIRLNPDAAFYLPFNRAWELCAGALLALPRRGDASLTCQNVIAAVGFVLIAAAVAFYTSKTIYPGFAALVPVAAATALIAVPRSWFNNTILSNRLAVEIGLISYPLYLWHWPLLWLSDSGDWRTRVVACITAIFLARLTYVVIERPLRTGPNRTRTTAGLISGLSVISIAGFAVAANGIPSRWPSEILALTTYKFDEMNQYRVGRCHLLPQQGPEDFPAECFGDGHPDGAKVILWGDSAATALYPGLHSQNSGSFDLSELTASACPPFVIDYTPLSERPHCASVNEFDLARVASEKPRVVILATAPNYETEIPLRAASTIAEIRRVARKSLIVLVGPPPLWPSALPETIMRTYLADPGNGVPNTIALPFRERESMKTLDDQLAAVAAEAGVVYVSSFRRLCADGISCIAILWGEPVAWDRFHLTLSGSGAIARDIYAAISAAIQKRD